MRLRAGVWIASTGIGLLSSPLPLALDKSDSLARDVRVIYAHKGRQKCFTQGVTASFSIPRVFTHENGHEHPNQP